MELQGEENRAKISYMEKQSKNFICRKNRAKIFLKRVKQIIFLVRRELKSCWHESREYVTAKKFNPWFTMRKFQGSWISDQIDEN